MPELSTDIFVDVNITLAGASAERFAFGSLCGVFDHSATANRSDGPYTSITDAEADGFTSVAEPEVNAWLSAVFGSHDNTISQVYIGREDAADADWTETLDAVEADLGAENFYFLTIESRAEADILLAAAWAETRRKFFIAQSEDAAILTDTSGNVAEDLEAAGYNRTALAYHQHSASADGAVPADGYLDGAVASCGGGLNLDAPNGAGTWHYLRLTGVTPDLVSSSAAANIYSNNANLYGRSKGLSFFSKGTAASGRFIDVQTSVDWLTARLEEEILSTLVGTKPKVPYTEGGIGIVRGAAQAVLDRGIAFGHIDGTPSVSPTITTPRIATVSASAKSTRTLTFTARAKLAGAIHSVVLNVTVEQ